MQPGDLRLPWRFMGEGVEGGEGETGHQPCQATGASEDAAEKTAHSSTTRAHHLQSGGH